MALLKQTKDGKRLRNIILCVCIGAVVVYGLCGTLYSNFENAENLLSKKNALSAGQVRAGLNESKVKWGFNSVRYLTDQVVLRQQKIGDFSYFYNGNSFQSLVRNRVPREEIEMKAENLNAIFQESQKVGAEFLYINVPSRFDDDTLKKLKNIEFSGEYSDDFLSTIDPRIPVIDARNIDSLKNRSDNYYMTDHHFTVDTSFAIFQETVDVFQKKFHIGLDPGGQYTDLRNYRAVVRENSFSGSNANNISPLFIGKEDFKIYLPDYPTDFNYRYLLGHKETLNISGAFDKALCDGKILDDDSYLNKYNLFLHNAVGESIITNNKAQGSLKVLVISSSFARIYVPYLSQCFKETRFLDAQEERYAGSVTDYISQYRPDAVIVMHGVYNMANVEKSR